MRMVQRNRSAEFYSAVSQVSNLQCDPFLTHFSNLNFAGRRRFRQSGTLRYSRVKLCATRFSLALLASVSSISLAGAEATTEEVEFFEKNVRPLFAENCYQCHSDKAEKIKGGLHLDSTAALSKGGTSGAAIVPGDPDASLLIKAVRYTDAELQMPPKDKKLPDDSIKMLETWVKMGAPMPKEAGPAPLLTQIATARARHWAFQLVKKPPVPPVRHRRWVKTPIDNFVLANLEAHHLQPAPAADRRSLIRRVTYDLIGLPPSYSEVQAFAEDRRPDAYARVVERLLASPHYGERWGRYWLDIARYADTKGYLPGGVERRYAFSEIVEAKKNDIEAGLGPIPLNES